MIITIRNKKSKYAEGICFEKNDKNKNTGTKNQYCFLSFFNAKKRNIIEIKEKITAWWSMNGVPTDGYANMETLNE